MGSRSMRDSPHSTPTCAAKIWVGRGGSSIHPASLGHRTLWPDSLQASHLWCRTGGGGAREGRPSSLPEALKEVFSGCGVGGGGGAALSCACLFNWGNNSERSLFNP